MGDATIFAAWLAFMAVAVVYMTVEEIKSNKRRKVKIIEPQVVRLLRAAWSRESHCAEDTIVCQPNCKASKKLIFDKLLELIEYRRPSMQYPLNKHWLKLVSTDWDAGVIIAEIEFPEAEDGNSRLSQAKFVWALKREGVLDYQVQLEFTTMTDFFSKHKHTTLLKIANFTESILAQLNEEVEQKSASNVPPPSSQKQAAKSQYPRIEKTYAAQENINWPSAQDYNEAIQNPQTSFSDDDLQSGFPDLNVFEVPKAISGAFASVYKIRTETKTYAVRCFLHPVKDQEKRYSILKRHLQNDPNESIIKFEYQNDGITISGKKYPILKMDWVDGMALNSYIEKYAEDRALMGQLRLNFQKMISGLRQSKIAHADLQHGNIIVRETAELVLVDYDGIFVPALATFASPELGHPNYQHPKRAGKHFGLFLDNFAGWLIDTSILCLQQDPSIWKKFNCGDEKILFGRKDLQEPEKSELIHFLLKHESQEIRNAVASFIELLKLELEEIPFLECSIQSIAEESFETEAELES